jgi:hypothetical protein
VKDKLNLWRLYNSATSYGKRPSEFMQLETDVAAWALDEACLMAGRRFENMLSEGKNPFSEQLSVSSGQGYAPVAKGNIKKMQIPASGVW